MKYTVWYDEHFKHNVVTVVKWLEYKICNHKVVGANPAKLTAPFTKTKMRPRLVTESKRTDLCNW